MIVALAGGVGGSKLVRGLYQWLAEGLAVIGNTADDVVMHGLHVSPDLDTLMYSMAGLSNEATGWGLAGDSYTALEMLGRYGAETWFRLGDRDLGTHLARTEMLARGLRLTEVTAALANALGIRARLLPMCDQSVATFVQTPGGELPFQEYFVRLRTSPEVVGVRMAGIELARPTPEVVSALARAEAVILGPSNPIVSLGPILSVPGMRALVRDSPGRKVAVSPIVGDRPVSGPAGRMMQAADVEVSVRGLAELYADLLDALVVDRADAGKAPAIRAMGIEVLVADVIMTTADDQARLAREVLDFASEKRKRD